MGHQEDTLAGSKSIGFDYQFYYFFYLILGMRHGQTVGLEVKDDIHVEYSDGSQELIQAKHSVQQTADDHIVALTNLDTDLWKTFSNWSRVILEDDDPISFVSKTKFILVSNKSLRTNATLNKIALVRKEEMSIKDFKKYLNELSSLTANSTTKEYILALKSLPTPVLKIFLNHLEFSLNTDNLIIEIEKRILEKIHLPGEVKVIYTSLHSELRDAVYNDIKALKRVQYSFDEFTTRFGKCFKVGLSTKLPIRKFDILLPDDPNDQLFIKQLIDIGDINPGESDMIIQYTTQMLTLYNQLKEWESNGDLLPSDTATFDSNTIMIWKNSFRSKFRSVKQLIEKGNKTSELSDEISLAALDCLDEMRKAILTIDSNILSTELSNGHFYLLTEKKGLGWHLEWDSRY